MCIFRCRRQYDGVWDCSTIEMLRLICQYFGKLREIDGAQTFIPKFNLDFNKSSYGDWIYFWVIRNVKTVLLDRDQKRRMGF